MKAHRLIAAAVLAVAVFALGGCSKSPEALKADLFAAVKAADTDEAADCIADGAKLNEPETPDGWYPIHYAARSGSLEMVKLLLENGADANVVGVSANQANDAQQFAVTPAIVAQVLLMAQVMGRKMPYAPDSPHRTDDDDKKMPKYLQIADILQEAAAKSESKPK
jgi:ankyrin repeat protein